MRDTYCIASIHIQYLIVEEILFCLLKAPRGHFYCVLSNWKGTIDSIVSHFVLWKNTIKGTSWLVQLKGHLRGHCIICLSQGLRLTSKYQGFKEGNHSTLSGTHSGGFKMQTHKGMFLIKAVHSENRSTLGDHIIKQRYSLRRQANSVIEELTSK